MASPEYLLASALLEPGDSVLLDVPYACQTSELNCGPTALFMLLSFLDGTFKDSIQELSTLCDLESGKAIATVKLATAAASKGFMVSFWSTSLALNPAQAALPYYQMYGDVCDATGYAGLMEEAAAAGVTLTEASLPLSRLLSFVTPSSGVIVLLNINELMEPPLPSYAGHFVSVVGYDDACVVVHDPNPGSERAFIRMPREAFDRARMSAGTDEDVVVIQREADDEDD
jgi:hypothetical protein